MQLGEVVQVEYVDLADPQAQAQYPELVSTIEQQNLPYPLVAINGHLRLAGTVQYYQLLPYVQEALRAGGDEPQA